MSMVWYPVWFQHILLLISVNTISLFSFLLIILVIFKGQILRSFGKCALLPILRRSAFNINITLDRPSAHSLAVNHRTWTSPRTHNHINHHRKAILSVIHLELKENSNYLGKNGWFLNRAFMNSISSKRRASSISPIFLKPERVLLPRRYFETSSTH